MSREALLSAGVASCDITPPLAVGLLTSAVNGTYAPFDSVRMPLKARVLVLRHDGEAPVVWVALDLLALTDTSVGGWDRFKQALAGGLDPERIVLTYTHTHSAPESVGLSGLYLTEAYRHWLAALEGAVREAIGEALGQLQPVEVFYSAGELEGFSLQRRIPTPDGIVMSDSVQPIAPELMARGPVDRRVHFVRFQTLSGAALATLVQAACHPVHEMCLPHVSPDFPGEMCAALDASKAAGMALFLNGAAGDTNPPTVSGGPDEARRHGRALAGLALGPLHWQKADSRVFHFARETWSYIPRAGSGVDNPGDAIARCSVLRIGAFALVFLPGEVFTETALALREASPYPETIVGGFGENNIGYLPTEKAFDEGGYEIGPGKWSFLPRGADRVLGLRALGLLKRLRDPEEKERSR